MLYYVVSYDVRDDRRRRRVVEVLKDYGRRVQESVFECGLDRAGLEEMVGRLRKELDQDADSCRIWPVCRSCAERVRLLGPGQRWQDRLVVVI